jgi:EAL domain-containing protein (putative c-di-GMP-specific phosphodiesterase class I)/GGDEF domain-containing protein
MSPSDVGLNESLPNLLRYRDFLRRTQTRLTQSHATAKPFVLLIIDLARLAHLNPDYDYGHNKQFMSKVTKKLMQLLPSAHLLCRRHQTEFLALVDTPPEWNRNKINHHLFLQPIDSEIDSLRLDIVVSAAIGASAFERNETDISTLISQAETALSEGKRRTNRHKITWHSDRLERMRNRRLTIASKLSGAISARQIIAHYQPEVEIPSGKILGFEALARWNCEGIGEISAHEFIHLAEERNLIVQLTNCVMEQVIADMPGIQRKFPEATISLNISPTLFVNQIIVDMLQELFDSKKLPHGLMIEITENKLPIRLSHLVAQLHTIRDFGIKIALDDFGRSYSSLSRLSNLPLDKLKIDLSFIACTRNPANERVINMIVSLGQALGMSVTAEGVETQEQMNRLLDAGCKNAQGWYYSKAVPIEQVLSLAPVLTPIDSTTV